VLLIFVVFCIVLLCVFMLRIPCCDVHYDFRIKTMYDLSLPPVVAGLLSYMFCYICVCLCTVVSNTCCVALCFSSSCVPYVVLPCVFLLFFFVLCTLCCVALCFSFVFLRLVYPMLPVALDCPLLVAPLVFSNIY
jgi:hypothetical protein